jgi:hypothetical protein
MHVRADLRSAYRLNESEVAAKPKIYLHHHNGRYAKIKPGPYEKKDEPQLQSGYRSKERTRKGVDETHFAVYWTHHVKPNQVRQHLTHSSHPTSNVKLIED